MFVNNEGCMSVYVYPYEKDEARWMITAEDSYVCSECGCHSNWQSTYCPSCGEKMKMPVINI